MAQTKAQIAAANKAQAAKSAAANKALQASITDVQNKIAATKTAIATGLAAQSAKQQQTIDQLSTQLAGALTPEQVQAMIAQALASQQATSSTANAELLKQQKQAEVTNAVDDLRSQLKMAGLESLVTVLDSAIKGDQTAAQIKDTIRGSQEYKTRFPGMGALQLKNQAITEAEYIGLEKAYTQTLQAYGLDTKTLATTSELGKYIGGQVSAREFEERVNDAATRVKNNPDVLSALSDFYGVDKAAATTYLLNPALGMDVVRKQVRASEIGAAAMAAKLSLGAEPATAAKYAESLTTQVGSEDLQTLKKEFGQAAILGETQGRLASIEGQAYTSDTAIQAAVVGNQAALLESQKRAAREAARFGGQGSYVTRQSTTGLI